MQISQNSQRILAELLKAETGQSLPPSRSWRIGTAMANLCREHGISDLDRLITSLAVSRRSPMTHKLAEALLNNETYFFRDRLMFDQLSAQILPRLAKAREDTRTLKIWSVGCASGQEALSLAMLFAEQEARWTGWNISVLGTDVSETMIETARAGTYTSFQIQRGLAVGQMIKWFEETPKGWRASDKLRRMVRFERHNLLDPLPAPASFDIVLCRNVLLYFDDATRRHAFSRLSSVLAPDGWLMLGAGETCIGQTDRIAPDAALHGLYRQAPSRSNATDRLNENALKRPEVHERQSMFNRRV